MAKARASGAGAPHLMLLIHSLRGGGAERVAAELASDWQARGWRVSLVSITDSSADVYPLAVGVRRHGLDLAQTSKNSLAGLGANLRRIKALRALLAQDPPAVLLGFMTTSSVLALLAARGTGIRVLASEHTHPPQQRLNWFWRRLRRWAYPRAQACCALTEASAAWLRQNIPGARVCVIPNAVRWPLAEHPPLVVPPPKRGRRVLLAVGRLHPVKGFDVLLRAFAGHAAAWPQWDLYIVGEGGQRAALQRQIAALALQERVFLPGQVGNIAAWYASADVFVLSSRTEGLSNTLLEAMASGLPCVAFDCPVGPREIITDGVDGLLVRPAQDAAALGAALARLCADEDLAARLGAQARAVRSRFGQERILRLWDELLEPKP